MNQSSSTSNNQLASLPNPSPFGGMARPPGGMRQAPQANQMAQVSTQAFQQLTRLLPHIEDTERRLTREQILEILAKDMKLDSIQALIASKQGQGASNDGAGMGGVDVDNGLNQEPPTVLDITVHLESQVNGKYSALLQNANYKGLSKRMIQSLKSNKDSRTQLLNTQELSSIEEFINQFTFDRPRAGGAPQVQESAGSVASAPTQASNPFAFSRPNQVPPPGGQKRPAGPQSRMPQQRFAVVNMFVPPTMEFQPGAINPIDNNQRESSSNQANLVSDGAAGSTKIHLNTDHNLMSTLADVGQSRCQRHNADNNQADEYHNQNSFNQEQERPSVQFSQAEPNQYEEEKGSVNYVQSDSGAADFINAKPSPNHQAFTDFEFFNNPPFDVSKNQVKAQSPLNTQNALSKHSSSNQNHSNVPIQNNQSMNQLEERLMNDPRSNKQSSKSLTPLHQSSKEQANQNNKMVEDTSNTVSSQDYKNQFQQFVQDFPLQEEQSRGSEHVQRITLESATLVQSTLINEEEEEQQQTQVQNTQVEEIKHQNLVPHFESFSHHDNQLNQGLNLHNKNEKVNAFNQIYDPSLSSDIQLEEQSYLQRQIREDQHIHKNQVSNLNQIQQLQVEQDHFSHRGLNPHDNFVLNERTNQTKHEDERLSFPNFPSQVDQQEERDDTKFNNQFNDQYNDQREESPQNDLIEMQQTLSDSIQNQRLQAQKQEVEQEQSQFERLDQSYTNYPTHGNQNQIDVFNQAQAEEGSSNQLLKEEAKQMVSRGDKSQEKQQLNQVESGQSQGKGKSGVDKQMKEIEDINRELQTSKHNYSVIHQQNHNEVGFDSLSNYDLDQYQSQQKDFSTSRNQSVTNFNPDHRPPRPQNAMNQAQTQGRRGVQNASPLREQHQLNPSQSAHNVNQVRSNTPTMQGLMQYSTSKPPQSVASINITNLEDSEALIRAYKKKKNELDELRDVFYRIETEFFTEKQRAVLFEEENTNLKTSLAKAEKQIREMQLKESGKDSHYLQKQLQLKTQECQAYQNELLNQKQENLKLRDRLKEQLTRHRHSNSNSSLSNSHQSSQPQINTTQSAEIQQQQLNIQRLNESLSKLTQEREDLLNQIQNIKMQNQNAQSHLNERLNEEKIESQGLRQQIQQMENNYQALEKALSQAQESLNYQTQLTQSKEISIGELFARINSLETVNQEQSDKIALLESQLQHQLELESINKSLKVDQTEIKIKSQAVEKQLLQSEDKTLGNFAKDVMSYFEEDSNSDIKPSIFIETQNRFERDEIPILRDSLRTFQQHENPLLQAAEQQISTPVRNIQIVQNIQTPQVNMASYKNLDGNMKDMKQIHNKSSNLHQAKEQIDEGLFGLPQVKATTSNKYNFFDDEDDDGPQAKPQTDHIQFNTFGVQQAFTQPQAQDKILKVPSDHLLISHTTQSAQNSVHNSSNPLKNLGNENKQQQNESAQQIFQNIGPHSSPTQSSRMNQFSEPKPPQQSVRQPLPSQMFNPSVNQQRPQNPMIRPPGVPQNYPRPSVMNQQQRPPIQSQMASQTNQQSAINKLPPQQQNIQQQNPQSMANSNQASHRQNLPAQSVQTPRNKYILDDDDDDSMSQTSYQSSSTTQNKQINQIHSSLFD